jgi:hypothetical protein
MTARHVITALQAEDLDPVTHWVFVVIANYANDDDYAWPATKTIADRCGLHPGTVRKAVTRLAERGFLQIIHKKGKARSLRITRPGRAPSASTARLSASTARKSAPTARRSTKEVQIETRRGDASATLAAALGGKPTPVATHGRAAQDCQECGGTGWRQLDLPRQTVAACRCRVLSSRSHVACPPASNTPEA